MLNKSTKRLLFLFISLIVMLLSGIAGYLLAQSEPPLVANEPTDDIAAEADNTRLSANAVITWVYDYEMCRHKLTETTEAAELAGLTFTELRQKYPRARIAAFGPGDATLELSFACYCPDHFILKKEGDVLALYRTLAGTDRQDKIREYPIDAGSLTAEEIEELMVGRVFADRMDAAIYVEKLRNREAMGLDE
ncbi:MAG: hypothetical protein GXW96_02165 [Christensenellaceae bacterium]|nr:hypothetical protein [Christensenellaceae bacterium]